MLELLEDASLEAIEELVDLIEDREERVDRAVQDRVHESRCAPPKHLRIAHETVGDGGDRR